MARKDVFHDHVRSALENDGWQITDDPYKIKVVRKILFKAFHSRSHR
ncbi:MAG: element excision factor XisH family protein [Saprospiraceae bacterium]